LKLIKLSPDESLASMRVLARKKPEQGRFSRPSIFAIGRLFTASRRCGRRALGKGTRQVNWVQDSRVSVEVLPA
jgi:hypothetical protein